MVVEGTAPSYKRLSGALVASAVTTILARHVGLEPTTHGFGDRHVTLTLMAYKLSPAILTDPGRSDCSAPTESVQLHSPNFV